MGWVDDLLDGKDVERERLAMESKMHDQAASATPMMCGNLSEAVASAVKEYTARRPHCGIEFKTSFPNLSEAISITAALVWSSTRFLVSRVGAIPWFELRVHLESGAAIEASATFQTSTSSPQVSQEATIQIIAKGPDNCAYRINGKDFDAPGAAQELLAPLLTLLD